MPNSPYTAPNSNSTYTPIYTPPPKDDLGHIRLLSIFHYIVAALSALFSLFPLIYVAMGIALIAVPSSDPSAPIVGWVIVVIFGGVSLVGFILAGYIGYAGRCLSQHRRHTLCIVVAGISCLFMPFGTILGVFTLIVLLRPSVKPLFDNNNLK